MVKAIRHKTIVQPGGLIKVQADDLPVGSAVEVIVLEDIAATPLSDLHPLSGLSREERIEKIRAAIGGWKDDQEMAEIFAKIQADRHAS